MGGIRIGGVATAPLVPVVYMVGEDATVGTDYIVLWGVPRQGGDPYRLDSTEQDVLANALLADPMVSPDGQTIVYGLIASGSAAALLLVDNLGATSPGLLATNTSTLGVSMQPCWNPAGTKICFRTMASGGGATSTVEHINPDGTGQATLYSVLRTTADIKFPRYSYDGQYISFVRDRATDELWVMEADGSNPTQIKTGVFTEGAEPSWSRGSNRLAYWTAGGQIRVIDFDGSNDTLLATDPDPFWGLTKWAWSDDDKIIMFYRDSTSGDPKGYYVIVDPNGGGDLPVAGPVSYVATEQELAYVMEQNDRTYWLEWDQSDNSPNQVKSCEPDGTGERIEHDLDADAPPGVTMTFLGFDGRSV